MKNKLISLFLLAAMLICSIPVCAEGNTDDFTMKVLFIGNSYSDDATDGGYMKGTNTEMTQFSPMTEFTREQFVQLLFNMEGLSESDYTGDTGFSDVPAGKWYSAAVKWALEA